MSDIKEQEVAAEICEDDAVKAYARLRASLESLGFVRNLLGDFLYTDIGYMGDASAVAMLESIKMRMNFIREATTLIGPSLDAIEEYLDLVATSSDEGAGD